MTELKSQRVIDDFELVAGKKHLKLRFQHDGRWHQIPWSMSPRTSHQTKLVAGSVRRIIRGKSSSVQ